MASKKPPIWEVLFVASVSASILTTVWWLVSLEVEYLNGMGYEVLLVVLWLVLFDRVRT